MKDEPLRAAMILGIEIAVAGIGAYCTGRWAMGLLIGGLLLLTSWSLWLPVRFELGTKGIVHNMLGWRRRISWSEFSGYELHSNGVFLSHHSNQRPLRAMRGLFLPSKPSQAELLAALDYHLRPRDSDS
jgi:hypothetical protein